MHANLTNHTFPAPTPTKTKSRLEGCSSHRIIEKLIINSQVAKGNRLSALAGTYTKSNYTEENSSVLSLLLHLSTSPLETEFFHPMTISSHISEFILKTELNELYEDWPEHSSSDSELSDWGDHEINEEKEEAHSQQE